MSSRPVNITQPFRHLASASPGAPAIIGGDGGVMTYGMLDQAIDRMAGHIARLGLRPGDIVGLGMSGPDETLGIVLALALARIGVATADRSAPAEHLRLRFHTGASAEPGRVHVDASWMMVDPPASRAPAEHADPAALCRVFESSGTTGLPKHIPVSHDLMARRVHGRLRFLPGGPAVRIIAMGLGGAPGFETVLRTLWAGGTLVLTNPAQAAAAILRHGVTSIVTSPITLRTILAGLPPDAPGPLPSLQSIEVGGSELPANLHRLVVARLCPTVISVFGSSEADHTAGASIAELAARPGAVGRIRADVEARAVDDLGRALPPGIEGILQIRGDRVASGYMWDDEASAQAFRDGWFVSGDIGAVWPDGMLTVTGRVSDLINRGGTKVSPRVIEQALLSLPTVIDAAAFGVPDASGLEQIWAAIVARARIDDTVLNAFCQRALPGISPTTILQMAALPRNENGKLLREQLVAIALRTLGPASSEDQPGTPG